MKNDLDALEQRWGLAVQSAGFGVWDLDVCNQRVHYTPQWKALLGYDASDEPDATATWRSRVHPDDLQPMVAALSDHLAGRRPRYEMEFRLRASDGGYRRVLSRGRVAERDPQGRALRAIGTLTDLTDRYEAERLRLERDRAEAASQVKTAFVRRMSHELRTPLNAVLGFAQLLSGRLGAADVEEQRRFVEQIECAGWRLLQMVDDVLDLSRIESGALPVSIEAVELAPLVQAALQAIAPTALRRGVQLRGARVPARAVVRADATRLRQVLDHLLSNAVKYSHGGGTVTVDVHAAPQAWCIAVEDCGIGIPAARMHHLFEPFNRLGRAASGVEGVGVGLVLTRALLQMMGGQLAVESVEGVGSVFEARLPAASGGFAAA